MVESYRDLAVWQKAMDLAVDCYKLAEDFPRFEVYGLTAQLQRAAVSVPANIAEGWGRSRTGDYLRYLSIAHGSLMELETHIQIAERLGYVECAATEGPLGQSGEVGRMLNGLINSLEKKLKESD